MPVFTDGIPVTERSGHGLGVRSIVYYVENSTDSISSGWKTRNL